MKKILLLGIVVLVTLISGCMETVHKESAEVVGREGMFEFSMDPETSTYTVQLLVRYSYSASSSSGGRITAELASPSGGIISKSKTLMTKKGSTGSKVGTLSFNDVPSEEGTYTLTFKHSGTGSNVKEATLKVLKKKE